MKISLSWSGDLSHKVALILRDWLPSVIQSVVPYVSSEDIDKGARWSTDIAKELEESSYEILCVTNENMNAPWLNFEAGALSKAFDKSKVTPFLFNIKRSEIKGPLLQFQSTVFTKDDIKKLILGINQVDEKSILDESRMEKIYDVWWPNLDDQLKILLENSTYDEPSNTDTETDSHVSDEILEEILDLVRNQQKILNSPEDLFPPSYLKNLFRRYLPSIPDIHPKAVEELDHYFSRLRDFSHSCELKETQGEELVHCIEQLSRPIEYLLKKLRHKSIRSFRNKELSLFDDE